MKCNKSRINWVDNGAGADEHQMGSVSKRDNL